MKIDFDAVILAAGSSIRMKTPKLSLEYAHGISFAGRCASVYSGFGCRRIAMVVNHQGVSWLEAHVAEMPPEVDIVLNRYPEKGRLFSLQCGLRALGKLANSVFVHNVDNPFITTDILEWLASYPGEHGCIRPVCGGKYGSPILLSPNAAKRLKRARKYHLTLREHLESTGTCLAETHRTQVLSNINTPGDYDRFFPGREE